MEENKDIVVEEQEQDSDIENVIKEALEAYTNDITPIILDDEELILAMDTNSFTQGQDDGNYIAGFFTQLMNFGLTRTDAMDVILNKMNVDHNIEVQKINLEISKNNALLQEKNSL